MYVCMYVCIYFSRVQTDKFSKNSESFGELRRPGFRSYYDCKFKQPSDAWRRCASLSTNSLQKLDLFHSMEIFWKYCRKRLENPISIVLSNSIVRKCFTWYGNIQEILWKYFGNRTSILWKESSFSRGIVTAVSCARWELINAWVTFF